jgi:curved DNA-binding protein CbpA
MTQEIIESYKLLELQPGAPMEAVRTAYRDLLKVWHPDRCPNDAQFHRRATEKTAALNEAYHRIADHIRAEDLARSQGDGSDKPAEEQTSASSQDVPPHAENVGAEPSDVLSRCPYCRQQCTIADSLIATWVLCPHCSKEFIAEPPSRDGKPIYPKTTNPEFRLPKQLPFLKSGRRSILEKRFEQLGADGIIDDDDRSELVSLCSTLSLDISELSALEARKRPFLMDAKRRVLAGRYTELVADGAFDKRDEQELRFVAAFLGLDVAEVARVRREGAHLLLANRLNQMLSAGTLNSKDLQELRRLAKSEGLQDGAVDQLLSTRASEEFRPVLARMRTSLTMTDQDVRILQGIERKYRCRINLGEESTLYRQTFLLESTWNLPQPIPTSLMLDGGEVAYFSVPTRWHQSRVQAYGYAGVSVSLPTGIRGVRFRFGGYTPIRSEELTCLSEGALYVTSARLLFKGNTRNTAITVGRIVDCQIFSDALKVEKSTGKPDFFTMEPRYARYVVALVGALKQT